MKFNKAIRQLGRFIWNTSIKNRLLMIFCFLLIYASSLGIAIVPLFFRQAIDLLQIHMTSTQAISVMLIFSVLFAYGITWLLSQSVDALRTFLAFSVISKILTNILSESFERFIKMDFIFHSNKKTGEIISSFKRMETGLPNLIYSSIAQIVPIFIQVTFAIVTIFYLFNFIYGLLLLTTAIVYIVVTVSSTAKSIQYQVEYNIKENKFTDYVLEVLHYYDVVKYFNNVDFEKKQIDKLLKAKEIATITMYKRMGFISFLQVLIVGIALIIITLTAGNAVLNRQITIGDFVLLNTYLLQFTIPMSAFGYMLLNLKRSYVDVLEFLTLSTSIRMQEFVLQQEPIIYKPDILFNNVTYHTDNQQIILDNVSFSIPYGSTVGIIGKTGAGKSTIVKLLLRFIEPVSGEILIGGYNIKQIPEEYLISLFGIVPQDYALFNRTIRENIAYGDLNATDKEVKEIMEKLQLSHLDDESLVGERGIKISGGEKQRIAIARIFLKHPQICIFDEFTSALDNATEEKVLTYVHELFKSQTKIIITHKLNNIANADKIIHIKNGHIV